MASLCLRTEIRRALKYRYQDGLTYREMAEKFGVSDGRGGAEVENALYKSGFDGVMI